MNVNLNEKPHPAKYQPYKLYILMRSDLESLNSGKAMAQAAHAANQFIYEHGNNEHVKKWQAESNSGFGTTVVLSVTLTEIVDIYATSDNVHSFAGTITDSTYPYIVKNEIARLINKELNTGAPIYESNGDVVMFRSCITCAYIFVADGTDMQKELVGNLPLHP